MRSGWERCRPCPDHRRGRCYGHPGRKAVPPHHSARGRYVTCWTRAVQSNTSCQQRFYSHCQTTMMPSAVAYLGRPSRMRRRIPETYAKDLSCAIWRLITFAYDRLLIAAG